MRRQEINTLQAGRKVSGYDLLAALIVVALFIGPMILLVVMPDNPHVERLLGGWRLFLFYGVTIGPLMLLERWMITQDWFKRSRFFCSRREPPD